MNSLDTLRQILDLARWAPSGDNTQPWRFELIDADRAVVHAFDTREHCVYDLDGHPSQIAMGALLETASIAASQFGRKMITQRRVDAPEHRPVFELNFERDSTVLADDLFASIKTRTVQRRPLKTKPLTDEQRHRLEASVAKNFRVHWLDSFAKRLETAILMFQSAKLRLTMPEAYEVHRSIIEWNAQFSADKVPDQALGTDPITTKLMQFVMQSWSRVEFFNRFLAGTWAPRLQLDFLPGIACAAHFVIHAQRPPHNIDDYVAAGRALQRFWLTASRLGLQMQPEVTPLVFSRYARKQIPFSSSTGMAEQAQKVRERLSALLSTPIAEQAVFMGRVGSGKPANARSLRRPLEELILNDPPGDVNRP